jgi:mannose-6-phosphate isomerase-like protein (cupin superfamily)
MLQLNMSWVIIPAPFSENVLGSIGNAFVVAEWQDGGGPAGTPRLIAPWHLHHDDDEAWYVLEKVLLRSGWQRRVEVRAGSGVLVPRDTTPLMAE